MFGRFFILLQIFCGLVHGRNVQKVTEEPEVQEEGPGEISSEGHFFQDIFSELLAPKRIQFGHVCENPSQWEQRFEEKDFSANRHQGKVKWGNKDGGYGEHYWDLNH